MSFLNYGALPKTEHTPIVSQPRALSIDWQKIFCNKLVAEESIHAGFDVIEKEAVEFVTKSAYKGGWNLLGLANFGTYTFSHKVEYEGHLSDGMFHGEGMLTYPMDHKVEGIYEKDIITDFKFVFPDGLLYEEQWGYCDMPDRRFFMSIQDGLQPAGMENLTNDSVAREIPEGCYDTGDGFFNPSTKCVQSAHDPSKVLRIVSLAEEQWILANCRKAWDEPVGLRPDFYERWTTGRTSERYDDYIGSSVP